MIPSVEGILNLFYTKDMRLYSIIIPVYNRPDELDDLLSSLCKQTYVHFEVIVVEDGSEIPAKEIVGRYQGRLDLHYYVISNSGPGMARNHGARQVRGEYLLILDSDVVLPSTWLEHIHDSLNHYPVDAFGGPDKAHASFSPIQKAINYAMTSSLTTGGTRNEKKKLVHCLPALFTFSVCLLVISSFFCRLFLVPLIIYALLLFVDTMFRNKCDLRVGSLSVIASFTQLFGYGTGFLRSII